MKFIFVVLFLSSMLSGSNNQKIKYFEYFQQASRIYSVELRLLLAIAKAESNFKTKARHINASGSVDRGVMQVSSYWIPTLKKYSTADVAQALYTPKYNIYVGAWILKDCIKSFGVNNWKAVDCYNKGAKKAKNSSAYIDRVWKYYQELATY